jgi:CRISPR-associated protein Cmr4
VERRLLVLMAETPVHAGGSESLGAVDLPIQRESATGLPVIWGQSLKGALRQLLRDTAGPDKPDEIALFGSPPPTAAAPANPGTSTGASTGDGADQGGDRSLRRGSVSVGDAQLLLFPVASLRQCFAWLTSPMLLGRLARKVALLGAGHRGRLDLRPGHGVATGTPAWAGTQVFGPFVSQVDDGGAPAAELGAALARLAPPFAFIRDKLATDVVTVSDTALASASKMATDVVARVQLKPKEKTVEHGPFYSEHLPVETVLTAVLASTDAAHLDALAALLDGQPLQLGGDETIGKGLLWCRVLAAAELDAAFGAEAPAGATAASPASPSPPARPSSPGKPVPPAPATATPVTGAATTAPVTPATTAPRPAPATTAKANPAAMPGRRRP